MTASETVEKPQLPLKQPNAATKEQGGHPGTMFDPETIRQFLDQLKKEDK